jgi:hypothetical protein
VVVGWGRSSVIWPIAVWPCAVLPSCRDSAGTHVASPRPPPGGPFAVQGASDKVGTADGTCACGRLIRAPERVRRRTLPGAGPGGGSWARARSGCRLWGCHRPAGIPRVPPSLASGATTAVVLYSGAAVMICAQCARCLRWLAERKSSGDKGQKNLGGVRIFSSGAHDLCAKPLISAGLSGWGEETVKRKQEAGGARPGDEAWRERRERTKRALIPGVTGMASVSA